MFARFSSLQKCIVCVLGIGLLGTALAESLTAQQKPVHPWIASAPGEFVRLIDRGNVRITVDDERVHSAGKTALTLFRFDIDYDFKFRHQLLGFDEKTKTWQAKITAWMDQPQLRLEHTICFQSTFNPRSPWESRLVKHEFDHVAISSDPRLLKIMKRTLQQRKQWTARWQQVAPPTDADIKKSVLDSVVADVKLFEALVQAQYDFLDQESSQGTTNIQDRSAFFKNLYKLEGLERCKLEMDKSMTMFIKDKLSSSASDKEVEEHYLFVGR